MELILTSKQIATHLGHSEQTWFLDLKEGRSLTSLCCGTEDYCLEQMDIWRGRLNLDGGPKHAKLHAMGMR